MISTGSKQADDSIDLQRTGEIENAREIETGEEDTVTSKERFRSGEETVAALRGYVQHARLVLVTLTESTDEDIPAETVTDVTLYRTVIRIAQFGCDMHIRRVRNDADSMRRFVEELWLPYQHDLAAAVNSHVMAEDVDVEEIVEFRTDYFDDPSKRLWVALDDVDDPAGTLPELDATFAGFLSTALNTPPSKFETPDKLHLGNFYVDPAYRGTGLADDLIARAIQHAREDGAVELTLQSSVDNDRALAYYEKLGFDVAKYRMRVPLEEVQLDMERRGN